MIPEPTESILVVDDEEIVCRSCDQILTSIGFRVDFNTNPSDGLQRAITGRYSTILLDINMREFDGLDFLERFRTTDRDTPVVMITAFASLENAIRATKLGAYDVLPKPFTPQELHHVVEKSISHLALLRKARELEAEKQRLRFDFLRVLAHELKAPLNAVEGYLSILESRTGGEETRMVLRSAERVRSMRKLITDLLDLTRIESGSKKQIHEKFDWLPLLENVAETARVSADPRGIGIRIRNREPFFAVADPSDLEMIANNLVSNAVKYNRDGGSVDLSLRRDGEVLSIEVADTGIGISEEDRGKLFSEFSRIRNAQTARIAGSGLGLSIVRKLAGLYGGDVSLQSRPGEGTVVTVRLREPKEKEHVQENPRH